MKNSQSPKVTYCMIAFMQHPRSGKVLEMESCWVIAKGEGLAKWARA